MTLEYVPIAWIYFIVSLNCNQVARCYSFLKQSITPSIHDCQPGSYLSTLVELPLYAAHTLVQ